jgi:hypothetical protein
LALIPKSHKDMVAALFRTIFAQPDPAAVSAAWEEVRDQLVKTFPKVGPLMDTAKAEVLAFTAFPKAHWIKIWSNNPLERINKEIKRRSRVVERRSGRLRGSLTLVVMPIRDGQCELMALLAMPFCCLLALCDLAARHD